MEISIIDVAQIFAYIVIMSRIIIIIIIIYQQETNSEYQSDSNVCVKQLANLWIRTRIQHWSWQGCLESFAFFAIISRRYLVLF